MILVIGLVAIAVVVGVVLVVSFTKDKTKKQPIRTVRCPPPEQNSEPESRYLSVTKTVSGEEEETEKRKI